MIINQRIEVPIAKTFSFNIFKEHEMRTLILACFCAVYLVGGVLCVIYNIK